MPVVLVVVAVPESPESITAEWLTEALRTSGILRDVVVSSFRAKRVGEKQGFRGALARFEISYSPPDESMPPYLVAKFSPPELRQVMRESNLREVRFYEEIAAGRDLPVPRRYYSEVDLRTGASILLLEDLSRMRALDFLTGCTAQDAEVAVRGLARFHAAWWDDPALQGMDWVFSFSDAPYDEWWAQYPQRVEDLLPEVRVPSSFFEFGERFAADMPRVLDQIEGSPATCIHRDAHLDNLLFGLYPHDPPVVVVDWQWAGRGKGVSDVAYLLISSLPPPVRRQSERRIVEAYHGLLVESGVQDYDLDQCWSDYIVSVAGKLFITVAATVLLDNSSPHRRAWRTADLQRLVAFIRDHDPSRLLDREI